MMNLMHKRLNKKGFTLAELLIVVAIIAILVAIAVPIFTNSLREAQLRTNQANARTVKVAGVNRVLANWNGNDDTSGTANKMSSGAQVGWGWKVTAKVDKNGDISGLKVEALVLPSNTGSTVAGQPVNTSGGYAPEYEVVVYLTEADLTKTS